jgi:hypothetical protein
MSINSISPYSSHKIQFTGEDTKKNRPGKNNLPAIASFLTFPGVGEMMNDQPDAKKTLLKGFGAFILSGVSFGIGVAALRGNKKIIGAIGIGTALVSGIAWMVMKYKSVISAYKYNPDNN